MKQPILTQQECWISMNEAISSADVVIVGGGLAGAAAALEAVNAGADVLLLEKMADTGGSSAMGGGCLAFAGTDLQTANGVEDSSDLLKKDLIEVGQGENVKELVQVYVQHETYQWLKAAGTEFSPIVEASSGQSVPRVHTVDPADLNRLPISRARASGRAWVLTSTPVWRTYCGLSVDREMQVRDVYGEAIDGLLAAGGLHGAAYMTGSELGKAVIFGRLTARTAVPRTARIG
jgi:succinate dehydrogenase/fumarate reductase flavoprotein subunit